MEYDNTNRGALCKININGFDRNCILIKRKNAQGQDTFEIFESMGNIKKISEEEKQNEKAPDGKGVVEVRKTENTMGIAFWRKSKKDGEGFLSVSLSEYKPDNVKEDIASIKKAFPDSKVLTDDMPTNEF